MFDGVAGTTAVTLTAKRTAAAAPMPTSPLRPRAANSTQQAASWIAQAPSWAAVARAPRPGGRETARPGAPRDQGATYRRAKSRHPSVAAAAHHRGGQQDDEEQRERDEAEGEELLGARVEEVGARDDDHAEQEEGEQVEQRLRDQGAEQHREGLPHATDPPRQGHGPSRLAEPGRQGHRH